MEKRCIYCNAIVDQNAAFCHNCGGANFAPVTKERKGGKGIWIFFVLAVLVIVGGVAAAFAFSADKDSQREKKTVSESLRESEGDTVDTISPPVLNGYTKGSYEYGVYTNSWADLYLEVGSDWYVGTQADRINYEDAVTECGFFASANGMTQFVICFEDVREYSDQLTVEMYAENVYNGFENSISSQGITCELLEKTYVTLAGERYLYQKVEFFGTQFAYQHFWMRMKEGRMIMISCTTLNEEMVQSITDRIEKLSGRM